MKIKQLKEKTAQGLRDFLPKIGVGDIEGLLNALNDKLSKSQGGEINKPITITNDKIDYSLTINPDSIYIWSKKDKKNILSVQIDKSRNTIDINNPNGDPINISNILNLIAKVGVYHYNIYSAYNDAFTASKFKLRNGTNKQVLLANGDVSSSFIQSISTENHTNNGFILTATYVDNYKRGVASFDGATKELAGLMTAADKTKLDNVPNIYAEKSEAFKTIEIKQAGEDGNDFDEGVAIFMNYANPATVGEIVVIDNATATKDGCMSHEDKNKLDNIEHTYVSSQNGNIYSSYNTDNSNTTLDVTGDYNEEGSAGRIRLKYTEDGKGKLSIMIDGQESSVNAEKFNSIISPNKNEVWSTDGGRINVLNLLKNAAIYVVGKLALAEGGIDNTIVIDSPDEIIFDASVVGGRFLARKSLICYTHWNADISKNIAPPSRYGIETNVGVFPFNNQLYKFNKLDGLYTATCSNGTCMMKKLTLK